jgi:hypothetical protein|tara:strand:- start:392 stop:1120 length:729 start_codon:yes stop_codon:yes gene_type:complete
MATTEEKTELVETIKGPRFYRIQLNGYGGESAYMSISEKAHDFWKSVCEDHGDYDLSAYMTSDDDDEPEFENVENVPPEAKFLHDKDEGNYKRPWYESHTEFEHSYGVEWGSAYIVVEEVDSMEYMSNTVADVIEGENLQELLNTVEEESGWELELTEMGCSDEVPEGTEFIAQMYSSEKGQFFDGVIETIGEFDIKKLKVYTTEYLNGEDTVSNIEYDGINIENDGGDTNGKGYSASVWKC